jgi:D-alanyl-D-alanine carboxypeptidase/D-alanyl-D-alanine-endopeptidase (penicillin-binding protein 4)
MADRPLLAQPPAAGHEPGLGNETADHLRWPRTARAGAHLAHRSACRGRSPSGGRLDGNLYLRGSGDPRLGLEQFWLLLRQLRARGVAEIGGDLVLDRSAFAVPPHDPGEFDQEPLRPYNAGPDALLVNLKSIRLTLLPDPARQTVQVIIETPSEGLRSSNRLSLGREACGDWREQIRPVVNGLSIELSGSFPAACGEKALQLVPWTSRQCRSKDLFRALWRELGGSFSGRVRAGRAPPARARWQCRSQRRSARSFATSTSTATTSWRANCS